MLCRRLRRVDGGGDGCQPQRVDSLYHPSSFIPHSSKDTAYPSSQKVHPSYQQAYARHYGVAESRAEGDHQHPYSDPRRRAEPAFMLLGEEEINQASKHTAYDDQIRQRASEIETLAVEDKQRDERRANLGDEVRLQVAREVRASRKADDERHRPARNPRPLGRQAGQHHQAQNERNQPHPALPPFEGVEVLHHDRRLFRARREPAHRRRIEVGNEIGDEGRPKRDGHPVCRRHTHEQVFGELIKRIVLVKETENHQGQRCTDPESDGLG